jgi:hypothetical protein
MSTSVPIAADRRPMAVRSRLARFVSFEASIPDEVAAAMRRRHEAGGA